MSRQFTIPDHFYDIARGQAQGKGFDGELIEMELFSEDLVDVSADTNAEQEYKFWSADTNIHKRVASVLKNESADVDQDYMVWLVATGIVLPQLELGAVETRALDTSELFAVVNDGIVEHRISNRLFRSWKVRNELMGDASPVSFAQTLDTTLKGIVGPVERGDGHRGLTRPKLVVDKGIKTTVTLDGSAYSTTADAAIVASYLCLVATRGQGI